MDFFTVPTGMLRVLYGFFVIEHCSRQILHFNATFNPTAAWVTQQIREAFSFDTSPKYLIFDRDLIFSVDVVRFVKAIGTKPRPSLTVVPGRTLWRSDGSGAVVASRSNTLSSSRNDISFDSCVCTSATMRKIAVT